MSGGINPTGVVEMEISTRSTDPNFEGEMSLYDVPGVWHESSGMPRWKRSCSTWIY